jgi:hypothetical protein
VSSTRSSRTAGEVDGDAVDIVAIAGDQRTGEVSDDSPHAVRRR